MTFKKTVLAIALFGTVAAVQAGPKWNTFDNIAMTSFEGGLNVFVGFMEAARCDVAVVGIGSRYLDISYIGVEVDGQAFGLMDANKFDTSSIAPISSRVLSALKLGSEATLYTDEGYVTMSLRGSAQAFDRAYNNCMSNLDSPSKQILPGTQVAL